MLYAFGAIEKSPKQSRVIIGLGITQMGQTQHMNKILYLIISISRGHNLYTSWCATAQRAIMNMVLKSYQNIIISYFRGEGCGLKTTPEGHVRYSIWCTIIH